MVWNILWQDVDTASLGIWSIGSPLNSFLHIIFYASNFSRWGKK